MSRSRVSYAKLGGFVIAVGLAAAAAASVLSWKALTADTTAYQMYFSESVEGLELVAPLKYRGVKVGTVAAIEIAPDGRHVQVTGELFESSIERIGLDDHTQRGLCAQLSPKGLTGMQLIQLDLFEVASCQRPEDLPFELSPHVIPVSPSVLDSVEEAVRRLAKATPQIAEDLSSLVERVNRLVGDVPEDPGDESATIASTLAQLQSTVKRIDAMVAGFDSAGVSAQAKVTLKELERTSSSINTLAERLEDRNGLVTRMERASTAMGDLAMGFDRSDESLEEALDDVGDAARAIRRLADALERDPDMLLKGRAELEP